MLTPQQARSLLGELHQSEPVAIAAPPPDDHTARTVRPARVGPFEIVQLIGHGGMGAVYEARQRHPRRRVAIKLLKHAAIHVPGARQAIDRFHNEVEILGRLEHPNIARLYEAGLHDDGCGGTPYFAMEYLPDAQPITDFARRQRLTIRQRLELFVQGCAGVQHGHLRGIVHRDLKPSNILVSDPSSPGSAGGSQSDDALLHDATQSESHVADNHAPHIRHEDEPARESHAPQDAIPKPHAYSPTTSSLRLSVSSSLPTVKIIDFGVARATDADMTIVTQHTATGQLIGTLQYMSPEQCDGDSRELDTRSDVYSLGVVLYELLCERLPYDLSHMTITGAAKVIQTGDVPAPHSWNRRLRGDLEAIILKAMHRQRDRRYGTAGELATDIRRQLNGEPITARTPGRWMKATRWMARHPVASSAIASLTMLLTSMASILFTGSWLARRPAYFEYTRDRGIATLYSIGNIPLSYVGSGNDGDVQCAIMTKRPDGSPVAIVATASNGGDLWICDSDDLEAPRHVSPSIRSSFDDLLRSSGTWAIGPVVVTDVFSQLGEEIIAVHWDAEGSPSIIRVYDFSLNVLCEAWYPGHVYAMDWESQADLLLCASDQHALDRAEHRDYPPYPLVVFAARLIQRDEATLLSKPSNMANATELLWHKRMAPTDSTTAFGFRSLDESWHGHFTFGLAGQVRDDMVVTIAIDGAGQIVHRSANDQYRALYRRFGLPAIDDLRLEDFDAPYLDVQSPGKD